MSRTSAALLTLSLALASCAGSKAPSDKAKPEDGAQVEPEVLVATPEAASDNDGSAITAAELQQNGYPYPSDLVSGANHTQKANYAWRLFIASMQGTTATPQDGSNRGTADGNVDFIDTGKASVYSNPLVFEGLYQRTEAFPYYTDGNQPASPVNQPPVYYTYYYASEEAEENDDRTALTVSGQGYVFLDETNQIGQNFLYYKQSNDGSFPVLFMAKVNEAEANYARGKSTANQPPSSDSAWLFPNDTLEVKTAWRRVSDIKNSDPSKYHQAKATYFTSTGSGAPTQQTDTFALIAIHIIQKTANYQQFVFTTFEHVDAVTRDPSGAITDPAFELTYDQLVYDGGQTKTYTATPVGAYAVNATGQSSSSNEQSTDNLPPAGAASMDPTVVVQPKTITSEVNDVNNNVNALIAGLDASSVWQHYRLKGVQTVPTSDQTDLDYYLANIVVESSQPGIQLFRGGANGGLPIDGVFTNNRSAELTGADALNVSLGVQEGKPVPAATITMGGCQGCHGRAQQKGRDFSFLAQAAAGNGKELDSVPAASLTAEARTAHNKRMAASSNYVK